ncbi:hypothetical protein [Inquilinus limosus]|uniref:Uncharacterized protein n=1 Tax=Inquilinus limosus TaxID=171674 RepID=A0A211ZE97_9PROT|nr:hypothetical protein [Inquilinus limosus]OWJ63609.1 hypothetical protein BWR60_28635 [Inquilinus limosus]
MTLNPALDRLHAAIADQRRQADEWRKPSALITFEAVRALDDLFCRELFEEGRRAPADAYRTILTWGGNQALQRVLPTVLETRPHRFLASSSNSAMKMDDFLFECAALQLGERYAAWLRDGLVEGRVRTFPKPDEPGNSDVIELTSVQGRAHDEEIGRNGLRWASARTAAIRSADERRLRQRHRKLYRELSDRVFAVDDWTIGYRSTPNIDAYFAEWARLYLERFYAQDLLGADDRIGGRPFSAYMAVLTVLSARAHKHIAFAQILLRKRPELSLRNLLTGVTGYDRLLKAVAGLLDADEREVAEILETLTLGPKNAAVHLSETGTCWAPLVRTTEDSIVLPIYGLDINPILFLLTDLRNRYSSDWAVMANRREGRWIRELAEQFNSPRWAFNDKNLKLKHDGKDVTDIDFAVFDRRDGDLALLQLKWQQPIGTDERQRRNAGHNLTGECNKWIERVTGWIAIYGLEELVRRLGFSPAPAPRLHLVILGRYHAHFTGSGVRDGRADWFDWQHVRRARLEGPRRSLAQLLDAVARETAASAAAAQKESNMLPIGDAGVILNPDRMPDR